MIMTAIPMPPISCDKQIAVAMYRVNEPLKTYIYFEYPIKVSCHL